MQAHHLCCNKSKNCKICRLYTRWWQLAVSITSKAAKNHKTWLFGSTLTFWVIRWWAISPCFCCFWYILSATAVSVCTICIFSPPFTNLAIYVMMTAFRLSVRLFVCRLWHLLSPSLGDSTWWRVGAYRIDSDICYIRHIVVHMFVLGHHFDGAGTRQVARESRSNHASYADFHPRYATPYEGSCLKLWSVSFCESY